MAAIHTPESSPGNGQWVLMWVVLALTPFTVWMLYAARLHAEGRPTPLSPRAWPWTSVVIASIAFLVWSFSLPESPFETFSWYQPAVATVTLLVGSLVIGLVGSLMQSRPRG